MTSHEMDAYFAMHSNTALAFYSFVGFLFVMIKVCMILRSLYLGHIKKVSDDELLNQRQEYQAHFFDVQEKRHDLVCKAMIDFALDAAICRKVLEDNNIKAFERKE